VPKVSLLTTDLNTLLTAFHVKINDHLGRPARTGRPPGLTDADLPEEVDVLLKRWQSRAEGN
jgi:hypothetical protein